MGKRYQRASLCVRVHVTKGPDISSFTSSVCHSPAMRNMYHLLVTLIRKLCAIVRPILNCSSHSSLTRLLNRLWSYILRVSRHLTSTPRANDAGDPILSILRPSAAASMTSYTPEPSPMEIEEGLPAAVDRILTEEPKTDPSLRVTENDAERRERTSSGSKSPLPTTFILILPSDSERYDQNIIMCVFQISNL